MNKTIHEVKVQIWQVVVFVFFSMFAIASAFAETTYTWTGGSGNDKWEDPANWDSSQGEGVPGVDDDAILPSPAEGTYTVTASAAVYDILQNVVSKGARFVPNLARAEARTATVLFVLDPLEALERVQVRLQCGAAFGKILGVEANDMTVCDIELLNGRARQKAASSVVTQIGSPPP